MAGGAGVHIGCEAFHPTVLVGQRNRLRASERPKRFLEDTKVVARQAGFLQNRVRVLDSTPIYDAVSTQDTLTQLRSAIRKLLRALDRYFPQLAAKVRAVLVRDALAALAALDGYELHGPAREAAELLALVAGQDVEEGDDGVFRIARKVAKDRVISTVDPDARHGHKSHSRRFDGYKGICRWIPTVS